jgi:hypothetical protein
VSGLRNERSWWLGIIDDENLLIARKRFEVLVEASLQVRTGNAFVVGLRFPRRIAFDKY